MLIGPVWHNSAPAQTLTSDDGRKMTIEVHEFGLLISDGGGATQVAHIEEDPADPNRVRIGERWFRAEPS